MFQSSFAQVIAQGVLAIVGELDRLATFHAAVSLLEPAAHRRSYYEEQPLELTQNPSSKTVGSTSLGRNAGRVLRPGDYGLWVEARCSVMSARLFDGRDGDGV